MDGDEIGASAVDTHAQWQEAWTKPVADDPRHGAQARKTSGSPSLGRGGAPARHVGQPANLSGAVVRPRYVERPIKNREFVPTVRLGLGIVLFPVWWFCPSRG